MGKFAEETAEHAIFHYSVRSFMRKEVAPFFYGWEHQGMVSRERWKKAGDAGVLCPQIPESCGGPGVGFKYPAMVVEELAGAGNRKELPA